MDERAKELTSDGPAFGTRSQTTNKPRKNTVFSSMFANKSLSDAGGTTKQPQTGRLPSLAAFAYCTECTITVSDIKVTLDGTGRCDDSSVDNFVSPILTEAKFLKGNERMVPIEPVTLRIALVEGL